MRKHSGFTLVELVVVVLILGILAAVAAPRMLDVSTDANEASLQQTLAVVRDAIERYNAATGGFPSDPSTDLTNYLRTGIPKAPIGNTTSNAVKIVSSDPIAVGDISGTEGWVYSTGSGEFVVNSAATDADALAYWKY